MQSFLADLGNIAVIVFTVTSMLSVGLAYTWKEILGPFRNTKSVLKALVANFVLVPLLGLAVIYLFGLPPSLGLGLFLVAAGAVAAFLIKLSEIAGVSVALSATVLLLLLPATVVYMPIVVPLFLPDVQVSAWAIGWPLFWMLLLPLVVGLGAKQLLPVFSGRLRPKMSKTSTVALAVLVVALALANLEAIAAMFGTGAILAALIILGGAYGIGYAMGGPTKDARYVVGFATGQRNYGAAMVVASQSLGDMTVALVLGYLIEGLGFAKACHALNMRGTTFEERQVRLPNPVLRNRSVWAAIALCSALLVLTVYFPWLSALLDTLNPGLAGWTLVVGLGLAPLVLIQLFQFALRYRPRESPSTLSWFPPCWPALLSPPSLRPSSCASLPAPRWPSSFPPLPLVWVSLRWCSSPDRLSRHLDCAQSAAILTVIHPSGIIAP